MTTAKPQLSLYNTLTRSKAPFVPMDANNVRLYACGPTVYDFAHIGNGRAAIVFDLLFRVLRHVYGPEHVTYVRNITDVDDKINARALRDHPDLPLNDAIRKVTETTAAQYQKDTTALGCLEPTVQPRATENIAEMQAMIQRLLDKGNAYEAGGEVLFAVDSMPDYGQLSGRNLEDNLAGARIAVESHKRNPADFVLWKLSSDDEPGWDSPWGRGRPGWHIECSAMSERYLGQTFDIHGGGLDLIFPHHENEIAQSRCAHGSHAMANVWMHNGFLQVEGQKMSKSLGNFFTIRQLLDDWSGPAMRLVMLQTHYRAPIDWTFEKLRAATDEIAAWAVAVFDSSLLGEFEADLLVGRAAVADEVVLPLLDDLNTPEAIAGMRSLYKKAQKIDSAKYELLSAGHFLGLFSLKTIGALLSNSQFGNAPIHTFAQHLDLYRQVQVASANNAPQIIQSANNVVTSLGLRFEVDENDGFVSLNRVSVGGENPVERAIAARLAALNSKNFAEADRIRNELAEQGIALMDYKDENGERQTKWEVKR